MSFIQVNHVLDWMYRNSHYTLQLEVREHCSTLPLDLTDAVPYLLLTTSDVSEDKMLELTGVVEDIEGGKIKFEFEPEDTETLLARTYNLFVYLIQDSKVYPIVTGPFGIVPTPLFTEEEEEGE
jgi:hypothetical protein